MTEEYIRLECGDRVDVESAGIEPGAINPVVVELLKEDGVDITGKQTRSVFDLHAAGKMYDYVITVCDPEAADRCPVFPAEKQRLHWPFPDPSKATGTLEEKLAYIRPIRDKIKAHVADFCVELIQPGGTGGDQTPDR
jgi:arsenate reductase (thioredoxin)